MLVINAVIEGATPLTFGAPIQSEKKSGEPHDEFEERTWIERAHKDKDGNAFVTPMAIKNCLDSVAQYLSESVPGKGSAKFTKHFASGVRVFTPMTLCDKNLKPIKVDDLAKYRMFVPSDGKRGGGSRVWRNYPTAYEWTLSTEIYVIDPQIDKDRIERYLTEAGRFIGIGSFRPQNRGYHGTFGIREFKCEKRN